MRLRNINAVYTNKKNRSTPTVSRSFVCYRIAIQTLGQTFSWIQSSIWSSDTAISFCTLSRYFGGLVSMCWKILIILCLNQNIRLESQFLTLYLFNWAIKYPTDFFQIHQGFTMIQQRRTMDSKQINDFMSAFFKSRTLSWFLVFSIGVKNILFLRNIDHWYSEISLIEYRCINKI